MPRNRTPSARPAVDVIKQIEESPTGLGDFARGILEGVADAMDFAAGRVEGARVHTFPVRQPPVRVKRAARRSE